jgi:glutathione synthase/RimK-type ligase-like ATP-grasp enzyme
MECRHALSALGRGDTAITRLDVLPTLDGVEPRLELLPFLDRRGIRLLNRPGALLAAYDKWPTADRLTRAGLADPRTRHLLDLASVLSLRPPVVLKPRFGSWG